MIKLSKSRIEIIPTRLDGEHLTRISALNWERDVLADFRKLINHSDKSKIVAINLTLVIEIEWASLLFLVIAASEAKQSGFQVISFFFQRLVSQAADKLSVEDHVNIQATNSFYDELSNIGFFNALEDLSFDVREVIHDRPSNQPRLWGDAKPYRAKALPIRQNNTCILPITCIRTKAEFETHHSKIKSALKVFFSEKLLGRSSQSINDFSDLIIYEICENVYLHSGASEALSKAPPIGLVGIKYFEAFSQDIDKNRPYSQVAWLKPYFEKHLDYGYLHLVVADSGYGIKETLAQKIPSLKTLSEAEVLKNAFEEHTFEGQDGVRRGLHEVREKIYKWQGLVSLRSGSSMLAYGENQLEKYEYCVEGTIHKALSGTQVQVIFPAIFEQEMRVKESAQLTIPDSVPTAVGPESDSYRVPVRSFCQDMEILAGEKAERDITAGIVRCLDKISPSQFLLLDLGYSGEDIKFTALERVLENICSLNLRSSISRKLVLLGQETIFRYMSESKVVQSALLKKGEFILGLDQCNTPYFLGSPEVNKSILNEIFQKVKIEVRTLKARFGERAVQDVIGRYFPSPALYSGGWFQLDIRDGVEFISCVNFNLLLAKEFADLFLSDMEKYGALKEGHFKLLSGLHAERFIETRLALQKPQMLREIARQITLLANKSSYDVVFSYSITGAILATYVHQAELAKRIVIGYSYADPTPIFGDDVREGETVLIVMDVVGTRTLMDRIVTHVHSRGASVVEIIVLVDTSENSTPDANVEYKKLLSIPFKKYSNLSCPSCMNNVPAINIDPITLTPLVSDSDANFLPETNRNKVAPDVMEVVSANIEKFRVEQSFNKAPNEKFWEMISRSHTLEYGHLARSGNHYQWYDHTERILGDTKALEAIRLLLQSFQSSLKPVVIDTILHPDNYSATILAHSLANTFTVPPAVICATRPHHREYFVSQNSLRNIENSRVILVDDSVNTGKTLYELHGLTETFGGQVIAAFVLMNRLNPKVYRSLMSLLGKRFVYVYRHRSPVYSDRDCRMCKEIAELSSELSLCRNKTSRDFIEERIQELSIKHVDEK